MSKMGFSQKWAPVHLNGCLGLLMGLLAATPALAADPVVSNVRGRQVGTNRVEVYYDISAPAWVSLEVSSDGGNTWNVPVLSVSQSVSPPVVSAGRDKLIIWDAGKDWGGQYSDQVRFKITAQEVAPTGSYMVVDLSGGPSASSYPVSYLNAVPTGGWTDEYKTTKLVMRKIPAGSFTMGSPTNELGRWDDETQHSVTLTKDYYIGVFEVTQKQWERVKGTWPSSFTNASYRETRPVERVSYYLIRENPANSAISPNWPASSQVHTNSFMGKLRAKTGLSTFDLPTEAQWEYACRAGTTAALNSGHNLTNTIADARMAAVGRYWSNGGSGYSSGGDTSRGTAKVGSYLPNAWGLYDMHGNVSEWCLDRYGTYPGAVCDPPGAASGSDRVKRGGSRDSSAESCRSARRALRVPDYRDNSYGFRLSRTLP